MEHLDIQLGGLFSVKHYGNLFEHGKHKFHTFLEDQGWRLVDDGLEFQPTRTNYLDDFNQLFQSWLFFGLLLTVLQPRPDEYDKFHFIKGGSIDTQALGNYLERWKRREMSETNAYLQSLRMIRAQVALEKARLVVFEYCSVERGKRLPPTGTRGPLDEDLGLSLMVLGETLMNAKSKIVEAVGFNIRGWHGSGNQGWGTPPNMISRMKKQNWCARAVHVLTCQLRPHATALLSAYKSHEADTNASDTLVKGHDKCTEDKCEVRSQKKDGSYKTQHQESCPLHDRTDIKDPYSWKELCYWIGPDLDVPGRVADTIKSGHIPLLEIKEKDGKTTVEVVPYVPHACYATISHVWSDGYGNEEKNELWKCQLDYFRDLIRTAAKEHAPQQEPPRLFWIDTLAIPILDVDKLQRKKAIRQIFQVYTHAKYTIAIDKGLCQLAPGKTYQETAMKILLSGWMRRLWTLQEAYLSRRLFFAFHKDEVRNLDDLEDLYPQANDILTSNIPNSARTYFHNLLGNDRRARINDLSAGDGFDVLANVWRAARWRTTNHPEHETLALATLLNVDYENTKFHDAGIMKRPKPTDENLEAMMRDLWRLLDKTCPGSIPPGIIFLPGERLSLAGFRWAPKTWMSAQEVDYPDPLAHMTRPAQLAPEGLLVQYPGFLLHAKNRGCILKPHADSFRFPIDSSLLEWYSVDLKDRNRRPPLGIHVPEKPLAIILCRERPRELHEIALLVEIEEEIEQRSFRDHRRSKIYCVSVERRIKIWREVNANVQSAWRGYITDAAAGVGVGVGAGASAAAAAADEDDDAMICGELLDSDQRWYVDGPRASEAQPAPDVPALVPGAPPPAPPSPSSAPVVDRRPHPPPKPSGMASASAAAVAATSHPRSASRRSPMMPSLVRIGSGVGVGVGGGQSPVNPPPLPPRPDPARGGSAGISVNGASGALPSALAGGRAGANGFGPPPRTMSNQSGRHVAWNIGPR